mmetsp:Transcript_102751/g.261036  ORF Transcript_102751/g.261036 Transcript_102751/m.261036 type:complete len:305 (-) Transcript_102751:207-1121(-)
MLRCTLATTESRRLGCRALRRMCSRACLGRPRAQGRQGRRGVREGDGDVGGGRVNGAALAIQGRARRLTRHASASHHLLHALTQGKQRLGGPMARWQHHGRGCGLRLLLLRCLVTFARGALRSIAGAALPIGARDRPCSKVPATIEEALPLLTVAWIHGSALVVDGLRRKLRRRGDNALQASAGRLLHGSLQGGDAASKQELLHGSLGVPATRLQGGSGIGPVGARTFNEQLHLLLLRQLFDHPLALLAVKRGNAYDEGRTVEFLRYDLVDAQLPPRGLVHQPQGARPLPTGPGPRQHEGENCS